MNRFLIETSSLKRVLAYIVDCFLFFIIGLVALANVGTGPLMDAFGGNKANENLASYIADTRLAYADPDGNGTKIYEYAPDGKANSDKGYIATPNGEKGYEAYLDKVWYYYTEFTNLAKNPDERVVARVKEDGTKFSSLDYYQFFFVNVMKFDLASPKENEYFTYEMEGENPNFYAKPVLNEKYQAKISEENEEALEELRNYFYNPSKAGGIYYDAIRDLQGAAFSESSVQTYYNEQLDKISISLYLSEIICFVPGVVIFFFIIPLCFKDGTTLGKKLLKLSVVDKEGVYMNKKQRILRPLIVTLINLLLFIPNSGLGIILYIVVVVVSFMMMAGKKRANIHERLTKTTVVDKRKSKIFENVFDKQKYYAENDLDEYGLPNKMIVHNDGEPTVNLTKEE